VKIRTGRKPPARGRSLAAAALAAGGLALAGAVPASANRTHVTAPASLDQFRTAPETLAAVDAMTSKLVDRLRDRPPLPGLPYDLRRTGAGQDLDIAWLDLTTPRASSRAA
jgi:hypothetical protein